MIVCAGKIESFSFAKTIGIGLIDTAINLTKICLENKPEEIIFIGTAGSYGEHKILDILESKRAANFELSFLRKDSYTPIENICEGLNDSFKNDTIVNCSNYISINEKLSKSFQDFGFGIENMEFYSVIKVANEFNIKVAGIFIVTNYTNENAHKDFIKNHKTAMNKLTSYLESKKLI